MREKFGVLNTVYLRNPSTIDDLGPAPEPPPLRFLFMGSIDQRKGIVDLLRAFEELKVGHEAELHICGGPVNPEVEKEFEAGVAANGAVHYHGYVSGDERLELIRQSHVLVLPSYSEGLPLVIVEFLRCGRPVVATAVGAIPEIIRDGENGVLIQAGEIDELSRVLKNIARDKEHFSNLRTACEQEKDQYSREIFCAKLSNIYGTVAD